MPQPSDDQLLPAVLSSLSGSGTGGDRKWKLESSSTREEALGCRELYDPSAYV